MILSQDETQSPHIIKLIVWHIYRSKFLSCNTGFQGNIFEHSCDNCIVNQITEKMKVRWETW